MPGIGGGRSNARMRDSSSCDCSEPPFWLDDESRSIGDPERRLWLLAGCRGGDDTVTRGGGGGVAISSETCARGCCLFNVAVGGRRINTCDLEPLLAENTEKRVKG